MTDLAEAPLSTVIDTDPSPSASGGGTPALSEPAEAKPAEPASLRSDLEAVFKEDAKAPKPDAEPEKPVKEEKPAVEAEKDAKEPEAKPDADKEPVKDVKAPEADPPKAEAAPAKEAGTEEKADGTKFHEPPKNFLPDSKDVWRNVPKAVRRDIDTMVSAHEAEKEQFRQVSERYSRLRDFDDLAQSNGRDLRESLMQVHQFENMMRQNPVAALNMALMQVGPRKADGQAVSLYEVAKHIVEAGPEGYQRMMQQAQQGERPQPPEDPRVSALQTELEQIKAQQVTATVIEPFKAKHERYDELKEDIAFFLKSGKIPQTLSPTERLAAAYDMAERINPSSRAAPAPIANDDSGPGSEGRADPDFSGSRSIKSSPGSVTEEVEDQASGTETPRESILKEMRRLNNR